jgi:5-methylcytosine-specific restriction endonuclease McrA
MASCIGGCGTDIPPKPAGKTGPQRVRCQACRSIRSPSAYANDLAHRRERSRAARAAISFVCRTCGEPFQNFGSSRYPAWCSSACKRGSKRLHPRPLPPLVSKACLTCDTAFMQRASHQVFCSKTCRDRQPWSVRKLRPSQLQRNDRRRAQRYGISITKIDRRLLYFVHGLGRCALCGDLIDSTAAPRRALSASLDHIVPLKAGGVHDWINVQLAHFGCNAQKGWRINDGQPAP